MFAHYLTLMNGRACLLTLMSGKACLLGFIGEITHTRICQLLSRSVSLCALLTRLIDERLDYSAKRGNTERREAIKTRDGKACVAGSITTT